MNQVYAQAFKRVIDEIKNSCPQIMSAFIFSKEGQIIAQDDSINLENVKQATEEFKTLRRNAVVIGDLEEVSVQTISGQINFVSVNDYYLATVSSKGADEKIVKPLIRVLIPIVIELLNQPPFENQEITSSNKEETTPNYKQLEQIPNIEANLKQQNQEATSPKPETFPFTAPVNQFMVEKLTGLLAAQDTVRIDNELIAKWNELYGEGKIQQVNIETLTMKTTQCKFKPIKDSKTLNRGIIQIPEKILSVLSVSQDELVLIKPVTE
jgi:predicted regulator of Ras-like GTPase activity (Roadblock/LC7/MglB family)